MSQADATLNDCGPNDLPASIIAAQALLNERGPGPALAAAAPPIVRCVTPQPAHQLPPDDRSTATSLPTTPVHAHALCAHAHGVASSQRPTGGALGWGDIQPTSPAGRGGMCVPQQHARQQMGMQGGMGGMGMGMPPPEP